MFESRIISFGKVELSEIAEHLSDIDLIGYSQELCLSLINFSSEIKIKIKLLIQNFKALDEEFVFQSLNIIGDPFSKIETKESFEILNNPDNFKLLELLKGKYIKTIYVKKNGCLSVAYLS